jgi:hypothetical protein
MQATSSLEALQRLWCSARTEVGVVCTENLSWGRSADGHTRVTYDLPSTLMSGLDEADVAEAARKLDAKLIAVAETISGATV